MILQILTNKITDLSNEIIKLNTLELNELITILEKYYNISSNEIINNTETTIETPKIETTNTNIQKDIDIYIESILPDKKISVLKVVKNLLNLGLKETKEIVDNLPNKIKTTKSQEEANDYKKELESAGAVVKLK